MKKYTKIWANSTGEKNLKEWKMPKNTDFGPYVVDDSRFIPMSEAVKRISNSPLGNDVATMVYDFPDGKITSTKIPFSRTRDGKGLAELSKFATEESKKIAKKVNEAKKEVEKEAQRQAEFNAALQSESN